MENKHLLKYTNIKKYWMSYLFMEKCFRCGITSEETRLFDAIAEEGIVKACKECIDREGLPVVKKPSLDQLKESEDRVSVRDKLSMMAGIESRKDSQGKGEYVRTSSGKNKGEFNLNDVIERNLEKRKLSQKSIEKLPPEKELVENFHWKVMRARRLKKISQEQLGMEIGESETAINMIETGELPEDFERLIKKLEAYLRIRLFKNQQARKEKNKAEISFDPYSTKTTTVGDLKDKEESQESEEEYPEQNKIRRSKLWNLFRKRARKVEEEESEEESQGQESYSENIDQDLSYDDLDDYAYQEYEKLGFNKNRNQDSKKQSTQSYGREQSQSGQKGKERKQKEEKQDSEDKKDKDELSRKDIDDLIFRKS